MKTIFLENGEKKIINRFNDLPEMTTHLFEVNLKLTPDKNLGSYNFGMPILILFMFFIKSLSKQGLRKKVCLLLWKICENVQSIEDFYNIEFSTGYILLKKQSDIKEKLRLINNLNPILSQISWFEKLFIRKGIKKFRKKIVPLIYDNDIEGIRSHRFGNAMNHLYNIFIDFRISTEEIKKSIIS